MNTRSYSLRLLGLPESGGQLKVSALRSVMDALQVVAERSTRLAADGNSTGSGPSPSWLVAATDFTVVGLSLGSTILHLKAPCLMEAAQDQVGDAHLWRDPPSPDDTALDLVADAIEDVRNGSLSDSRVDTSVRQAILKLVESAGHSGVRFELESQDGRGKGFVLDRQICKQWQSDTLTGHAPRACTLSGRLELIPRRRGDLRLVLDSGQCLDVQVDFEKADTKGFSFSWDREATIEGIVSFDPNGRACSIEANRITARKGAVRAIDQLPKYSNVFDPEFRKRAANCDLTSLIGIWPGDETFEELLALLD